MTQLHHLVTNVGYNSIIWTSSS